MLEFRVANERWKNQTSFSVKSSKFFKRFFSHRKNMNKTTTQTVRIAQGFGGDSSLGALVNASLQVSVAFYDFNEVKSHMNSADPVDRKSLTTTRRKKFRRQHASSLRYLPMSLVMKDHPFFEQTWYARHILDHTSPLVKPKTRKLIKLNQGRWPRHIFGDEYDIYSLRRWSEADWNARHPLVDHLRKFEKVRLNEERRLERSDSKSNIQQHTVYQNHSARRYAPRTYRTAFLHN